MDVSQPTDAVLARAWAAGDEWAYETIVARYAPLVYSRCRRALGATDADDATQAVFLILARKREQAAASPAFAAWLMTVASNVVRNAWRDRQRRRNAESSAPPLRPAAEEPAMPDIQDHLDACLAELPVEEREAVTLHHLAGRSLAEVAAETGAGRSTVKDRLHRGLERLRTLLARRGVVLGGAALATALASEAQAAVPAELFVHLRDLAHAGGGAGSTAVPPDRVVRWSHPETSFMTTIALTAAGLLIVGGAAIHLLGSAEPAATPPPPPVGQERLHAPPARPDPLAGWYLSVSFGRHAGGGQRIVASVWRVTRTASGGLEVASVLNWDADERQPGMPPAHQRTSTGTGLLLSQQLGPGEVPVSLAEGRATVQPADPKDALGALFCAMCSIETNSLITSDTVRAMYDIAQAHPDPLLMENVNQRSTLFLDGVPAELPLPEGLPVLLAAIARADLGGARKLDARKEPDCPRERLVRSLQQAVRRPITLRKLPAADAKGGTF